MRKKTQLLKFVEKIITITLLLFLLSVIIVPFIWMVSVSLKPDKELFVIVQSFLPKHPTLEPLITAWQAIPFLRYYLNSAIVTIVCTIGGLFFCSLTGYGLSKFQFRGRQLMLMIILGTIMIPFQIIMIPLYVMMTKIGWNDTYQGVIFPSLIAGFGVFLIRQNMINFPDDLLNAARIEGCGEFRIYRSIVIPNIKAALATLGIYTFMANWDDFLWPLVVLSSNKLYTIPLGLAMFSQRVEMMGLLTWNISVAAAIIAVAPVLVAFIFFQKYIVKGVLLSGMGGR